MDEKDFVERIAQERAQSDRAWVTTNPGWSDRKKRQGSVKCERSRANSATRRRHRRVYEGISNCGILFSITFGRNSVCDFLVALCVTP